MKIGVISDTHNNLTLTKEVVSFLQNEGIDYLLHAGDIGKDVFRYLKTLDFFYAAVIGNNDRNLIPFLDKVKLFQEPHYFKIKNLSFKLMHHPYYLTPDTDIIIYGHLHKFACEKKKSIYLNPGEVCAREKPRVECAIIDENLILYYCYKELTSSKWQKVKVCQ